MRPEAAAAHLLAVTRSKAKMYEYDIPEDDHIQIREPLPTLIDLTLGMLTDLSADIDDINIDLEKSNLLFSARYFDSLYNSKSVNFLSEYLKLLGASAFYLGGFPGSSSVLVKELDHLNLDSNELENVLLALLKYEIFDYDTIDDNNPLKTLITDLMGNLSEFYKTGNKIKQSIESASNLKKITYSRSDRELLLGVLIYAICKKFISNSVWNTIPIQSGLDVSIWRPYFSRAHAIKQLWPAQLLIGENDVYKGSSAVIQMPSSAGKTKSTELIIRSSMLSKRSNKALIVAPLRALCQEIYNSLYSQFLEDEQVYINLVSDVLQKDIETVENPFQILILTPEKLDYILRLTPDLADEIGLIIYDEGHLLDDNSRGPRYELLLASLKQMLNPDCQIVLISAVIPNAEEIGNWLIGDKCKIVKAKDLYPTSRSTAFINWREYYGRLYFVNEDNLDQDDFFVPRVLEIHTLTLFDREKKERVFPNKDNPREIALALGCKVVKNGSVAIFTGTKASARKMADVIVDAFNRKLDLPNPSEFGKREELIKLSKYIFNTLGDQSIYSKAAELGIFVHHASTPHGLRLSVEYALQEGHAKFVISTSTLAQGVNLPIRYLIITTTQQGKDEIKIRDFHNLIGRVGRAGKYTEGTVIFTDRTIYERKFHQYYRHKWEKIKKLLNADNAESCSSYILSILEKVPTDDKEKEIWFKNVGLIKKEIRLFLLNALSYLPENKPYQDYVIELAQNTLAYFQADQECKDKLIELFLDLANDIINKEPIEERRRIFSRSILSIEDSQEIMIKLNACIDLINNVKDSKELFEILSNFIFDYIDDIPSTISRELIYESCAMWISGSGYPEILSFLSDEKFGNRKATIDHIVALCENTFGYKGSFIIGSCLELLELVEFWDDNLRDNFLDLQKRLKYGLPEKIHFIIYEVGLSDRNLAMQVSDIIGDKVRRVTRNNIIKAIEIKKDELMKLISENYPYYFRYKLENLLS